MRRSLALPTALLLSALALTGCAAAGDYSETVEGGAMPAPGSDSLVQEQAFELQDGSQASTVDRQVITTGWVTITVSDPRDAAAEAVRITESVGGRVDGRSEYAPRGGDKGSATLTLRLPADDLTETLEKLEELGDVQEVSLNATDVTMETQDLDARISAMSASIERLTALLVNASTTEALIQLETAISDRQAQLESMEAQRRYLSDQVSLSTVTLNLVTEQVVNDPAPDNFIDGIIAGWNAFVAFFAGLLVVLGVLVPWLVLAGIITFLVVFFVKRRSKARTEAPTE